MRSHVILVLLAGLIGNDSGSRFTFFEKRLPESFQGATITGTVVDARTMQPLRGAIVIAARVRDDRPDAPANTGYRTGEDGKFVLRGVAAGIVNFFVVKAGYAPGPFTSVRPALDGLQIDNVVLTVPPGASISGRIVDESGHPVAGIQVTVRTPKSEPGSPPIKSAGGVATSNDDGRYLVGGLGAGDYQITLGSMSESVELVSIGRDLVMVTNPPSDRTGAQSRSVTLAAGEQRDDLDLTVRFPVRLTAPKPLPIDGTATVEGRVTDSTGLAVSHSVVWLREDRKDGRIMITRSDAAGRFVFQRVPAGSFVVAPARYSVNTAGIGEIGSQATLQITPGSRTDNVVVTARRGGTISGTLTDEFGDPALASVMAISPQQDRQFAPDNISIVSGPNGVTVIGRPAQTDARGRYRITGLPPGEYVVNVLSELTPPRTEIHFTDPAGQPRLYTPGSLFYPGVTAVSQASRVTVTEGGEAAGIDVSVRPSATAQIALTVSAGRPIGEIQVHQIQLDPTFPLHERTTRTTETSMTLETWPGRYRLMASAEVATNPENVVRLWASADVDTDSSFPATVTLHLEPGANVGGRIFFEGTERNRQGAGGRLVPMTLQPQPAIRTASSAGSSMFEPATGLFTIEGIMPGQYVIQAGSDLWTLKAATIGGRDVLDEPLELRPGDDIDNVRLTLTDRVTELSGKVTDASGRPVVAEWVLVVPGDKKYWWPSSRRIRAARLSATGQYVVRGLPAGSYTVTTAPDPKVLMDPSKLPGLAGTGTRLTLAEGERRVQDLKSVRR